MLVLPRTVLRCLPVASTLLIGASALADPLPLDTILVTANRVPTPADLSGSSVSVLTGDDLAAQQFVTVDDALRQLPAVEVTETGGPGGTTAVMLRGLDAEHTKMLIDGMDVADPSSSAPYYDFADLLTAGIDRIEVVRGPQSTLYGSDAMGGIINVVTRSGREGEGEDLMAEAGSYGTVDGSASVRGLAGPLDFAVGIAGEHTDGIVAADARNGNHQLDPYDNLTATLKLGLPIGDSVDLGTVFRYTDSTLAYPGFSFVTALPADAPGQFQTSHSAYGRIQATFKLFDGQVEDVLGVGVTDIVRDYLLYDVLQDYFHGRTNQEDDQLTWKALPWLTAVAGGQSKEEDYDDSTGLTATQRTDAGYVEFDATPAERLALTAGVRGDQVEGGAGDVTYRLTASWQPDPAWPRLHASDGTGFKIPSLYQLFANSPFVLGDPNLKPETSEGWDAGLEQALPVAGLTADATWFYNDIHNLIDGFTDQNFVFHYANVGHARTYGVETSLAAHPLPVLDLKASYTWLRTDDLTNGGELIRRPHHTLSGTATWRPAESVQTFATVTWIGARNDDDFQFGAPPIVRLAPYALVSFGGSWQATDCLSIFARMTNALDRHYEEVLGYGTPGRAAYAGIKASF